MNCSNIQQQFIKQQLDQVEPWYSETLSAQSVGGIINLDFTDEKVKVILCNNIWIDYNNTAGACQLTDQYGKNLFLIQAPVVAGQLITGMFTFFFDIRGSVLNIRSNRATCNFSVFFRKVFSLNDNA